MRICMFVNNDMVTEPRVARHAETLGKAGHTVLVVCRKSPRTADSEKRNFYSVKRCHFGRLTDIFTAQGRYEESVAPASRPRLFTIMRTIGVSIRYFISVLGMMLEFVKAATAFNAHIYTSNDLDTLVAGVLSAGTSRKLIYDTHELWPDMMAGMGHFAGQVAVFRMMESVLVKRVDAVITVNEFIAREFAKRYHVAKPRVILNVPRMGTKHIESRSEHLHAKKVALYQGGYVRGRGLENVVKSSEYLEGDIVLVMRGFGELERVLRQIGNKFKNCRFAQPVPHSQTIVAASTADVGIVSYLPVDMNNYFASPNKLFEYIQAGIPVVASDLPFLRKVVTGSGIGCLFDANDPKSIAAAINHVTRDRKLRILRKNVRNARRRYCWEEEERKLLSIYQ